MRINHTLDGPTLQPTVTAVVAVGAPRAVVDGQRAGAQVTGKVSLSAKARELALGAAATVDTAKVQRLREAVQNGTLAVDAKAIADKLVGGG
jgi:flagellar biosynthesis anti-sigma factor FlgM